nr:hypothetical protein BaRGS_015158 [Batillaria attramentaria]
MPEEPLFHTFWLNPPIAAVLEVKLEVEELPVEVVLLPAPKEPKPLLFDITFFQTSVLKDPSETVDEEDDDEVFDDDEDDEEDDESVVVSKDVNDDIGADVEGAAGGHHLQKQQQMMK